MSRIQDALDVVVLRKGRLIERCEAQRAAVRREFAQLQGPIRVIDRGLEGVRYVRSHPVYLAGVVAVVVALRGRGVLRFAGRVFSAWRMWRAVASWVTR